VCRLNAPPIPREDPQQPLPPVANPCYHEAIELPRVYPILDIQTLARRGCAVEAAAEAMLEGGAGILQFRHKGHYSRAVFPQAERVAALARQAGATFIVDDRADIALLLDAGLHLGQDDLAPSDARRLLGPGRILGFSTHNAVQLAAAAVEPADYLAFGPIFATRSKENPDPVVGLAGLSQAKKGACPLPLVAIGGITRANALDVLRAGADSLAVIRDILPETCTFLSVRARMEEWQKLVKT
jgi:thiamine-phosphate pyrophosphorylase